jgi:hypothetical protein
MDHVVDVVEAAQAELIKGFEARQAQELEVGARDEDELANGRRTAMGLGNRPDLDEEGDVGNVAESASWVADIA